MGAMGSIIQTITDMIKMNDKITSLSKNIKELSDDVRNIDGRVIRLETLLELAEKQQFLRKKQTVIETP